MSSSKKWIAIPWILSSVVAGCGGTGSGLPQAELEAIGSEVVAWRTLWFEEGTVGSGWGRLTETAPSGASTMDSGWTVGNEPAGKVAPLSIGMEQPESAFTAERSLVPGARGLRNCFRSESAYTHFTSGQPVHMELAVRAVSSGGTQDGHANVALFRCADDLCTAGAEEVSAWSLSNVTNLTTTPQTMKGTGYEAATYHGGSYYFLCLEWAITGAGTNNKKDVRLRVDRDDSWISIPFVES